MTAFNIVRFRVKPGQDKAFLDAHKNMPLLDGMVEGSIVKTGERAYCLVGKWTSMDKIVAARPKMIGILDDMRGMLEDLGGGLGVTDPISGDCVMELHKG